MGFIRYVSTGKKEPPVKIKFSMNKGIFWQYKDLLPGQSFPIPPFCTNLFVDNVPYDTKSNYEIRAGHMIQK